jgi:hypothetical protein
MCMYTSRILTGYSFRWSTAEVSMGMQLQKAECGYLTWTHIQRTRRGYSVGTLTFLQYCSSTYICISIIGILSSYMELRPWVLTFTHTSISLLWYDLPADSTGSRLGVKRTRYLGLHGLPGPITRLLHRDQEWAEFCLFVFERNKDSALRGHVFRIKRIIHPNSVTGYIHRESGMEVERQFKTLMWTEWIDTPPSPHKCSRTILTIKYQRNWLGAKRESSVTGKRGDDMQVDPVPLFEWKLTTHINCM